MPGKACDKYTGAKKQRCLNYTGEFAKDPSAQKEQMRTAGGRPEPSTTAEEEQLRTKQDIVRGKGIRRMKQMLSEAGPEPFRGVPSKPIPRKVKANIEPPLKSKPKAKPKKKKKQRKYSSGLPGRNY